ncbi:hypothetical protein L0337_08170 [candidate division KSB1 bacterium]|nr:hypothetical protein [candidate division KSB1 bacterium]
MQTVLRNIPDQGVKAYIIWMPVLPTDNRNWAVKRTREFSDSRLRYFWDGEQLTGQIWLRVLGLDGPLSWDTYFLYGHKVHWTDQPTLPDFWMHQLSYEEKRRENFLAVPTFEHRARELLEQMK